MKSPNSVLVSDILKTAAENLNEKVANLIDVRLFLFCNFEPIISYSINEDGRFKDSIDDLYNFACDSNFILKNTWHILPDYQYNESLKKILQIISMLRSVNSHNQSDANGLIQKNRIQEYREWVIGVIDKEKPTSNEDFSKLNSKLLDISKKLIFYIDEFVLFVSKYCDSNEERKNKIVKKWITDTIDWYSNNTKTEIYSGYLRKAYLEKSQKLGRDIKEYYRDSTGEWKDNLSFRVKAWIRMALYYNMCSCLKNIMFDIIKNSAGLNRSVYEGLKFIGLPSKDMLKNNDMISTFERDIISLKKHIKNDLPDAPKKTNLLESVAKCENEIKRSKDEISSIEENCLKYFYKYKLKPHLNEVLNLLNDEKENFSLLPQDFFCYAIDKFFDGVPARDF